MEGGFERFLDILEDEIKEAPPECRRRIETFCWQILGKLYMKNIPPTPENYKKLAIDYLSTHESEFKFQVLRVLDLAIHRYLNERIPAPASATSLEK